MNTIALFSYSIQGNTHLHFRFGAFLLSKIFSNPKFFSTLDRCLFEWWRWLCHLNATTLNRGVLYVSFDCQVTSWLVPNGSCFTVFALLVLSCVCVYKVVFWSCFPRCLHIIINGLDESEASVSNGGAVFGTFCLKHSLSLSLSLSPCVCPC